MKLGYYKHPLSEVSSAARIGRGTQVWAFAQIREGAEIGEHCVVGKGAYVDTGVKIGNRCNIHNHALLYRELTLEEDIFVGPGVCFTNDPRPRANQIKNLEGHRTLVKKGASIGANATIMPDVIIGQYAMVGAGAVVTEDVPDYALMYGVPARVQGRVNVQGQRVEGIEERREPRHAQ